MSSVRPMTIDDYAAVYALWQRTEGLILNEADSKVAIARYLERNPGISHVGCAGDEMVGAALCGHDGRRGMLYHLAVELANRRRGIGRAIVDACRAKLIEQGIDRCNVYVIADSAEAICFWTHVGFRDWPEIRLMSKDWDSAVC